LGLKGLKRLQGNFCQRSQQDRLALGGDTGSLTKFRIDVNAVFARLHVRLDTVQPDH
jgi:hypothetical protein